jgi:predicted MFS family arabinose efflux permease
MNVAGHSIGRALGAFLAAIIYQQFGFTFVALTAVIFNVAALLALRRLQKG